MAMTKEYNFLHAYISKNGFEKLTSSSFSIYKAMLKEKVVPKTARLVLLTLLCGAVEKAREGTEHLSKELSSNPFLTADDVYEILVDQICSDLDSDLEDYCNADDYYEPYLEEFVGESTYNSEVKWKSWGLEIISFEGSGDVDFEP